MHKLPHLFKSRHGVFYLRLVRAGKTSLSPDLEHPRLGSACSRQPCAASLSPILPSSQALPRSHRLSCRLLASTRGKKTTHLRNCFVFTPALKASPAAMHRVGGTPRPGDVCRLGQIIVRRSGRHASPSEAGGRGQSRLVSSRLRPQVWRLRTQAVTFLRLGAMCVEFCGYCHTPTIRRDSGLRLRIHIVPNDHAP